MVFAHFLAYPAFPVNPSSLFPSLTLTCVLAGCGQRGGGRWGVAAAA